MRAVATSTVALAAALAGCLAAASAGRPAAPRGDVTVAAASSLRALWPALEAAWHDTLPGVEARPTFGASLTLARQIARGAPFELLLAADEASIENLPLERVDESTAATYATGRLALVLGGTRSEDPDGGAGGTRLDALARRLADDPGARLAIPSPVHAPYGIAAREALEGVGLWPLATGRLVVGENAAQTLQFVLAGAVDAALVPLALVADATPSGRAVTLVDDTLHAPLVHRLVATADASPAARALAAWFLSDAARAVLERGGFDAPPTP